MFVVVSFGYTGSIISYVFPLTATCQIVASGAQGGSSTGGGGVGGLGASVQGLFSVTAGQTFTILVGGQPASTSGFPAGGGGTFVALGSSYTTATAFLVAGGGGGVYSGTAPSAAGGQISQSAPTTASAGNGAPSVQCCGGGGGFLTSGGSDTSNGVGVNFPGGTGFSRGGAATAAPPSPGGYTYSTGG